MPEIENLHAGSWRVAPQRCDQIAAAKAECISFARREANGVISEDSRNNFSLAELKIRLNAGR
jgi:hypothetical protein